MADIGRSYGVYSSCLPVSRVAKVKTPSLVLISSGDQCRLHNATHCHSPSSTPIPLCIDTLFSLRVASLQLYTLEVVVGKRKGGMRREGGGG